MTALNFDIGELVFGFFGAGVRQAKVEEIFISTKGDVIYKVTLYRGWTTVDKKGTDLFKTVDDALNWARDNVSYYEGEL